LRRCFFGELKTAVENVGLAFCASNHRAEHYFFMNMGRTFDSDVCDERYADYADLNLLFSVYPHEFFAIEVQVCHGTGEISVKA